MTSESLTIDVEVPHAEQRLSGCRVIGLLNGIEMFGLERANIEVFKSLRRQGADVTVGVNTVCNGGELRKYVEELGFETFSLPFGCQWSKQFFRSEPSLLRKNVWRVLLCSHLLSRAVRQRRTTHVHLGNLLAYSFIAPCLTYHRRLKLVYRMGDTPPCDSKANFWIWKRCLRRAHCVIANSAFVRASIMSAQPRSRTPIQLIYNVAPVAASTHEDSPASPLEFRKPAQSVLYVGQISEHKGVHHFVDAAIALAKLNREWRFDIVGGSIYTPHFESSLKSRIAASGCQSQISMHGSVADPAPFYHTALVIVVPSLSPEPAANVVLEAKRVGVPAIVYRSGGLPELVTEGQTGWICPPGEQGLLQERIWLCLSRPQHCVAMRRACLDEYQNSFGQQRFDEQWAHLYRTTTGR